MIKKLRGILDFVGKNYLILDVNSVFYQIFCSSKTLQETQNIGGSYTIFTELVVREDSMTLYGFIKNDELDSFKIITNVQGVGMKVGLSILSVANSEEIYKAINAQQEYVFTAADGVGPKLAKRIINELKGKYPNNKLQNIIKSGENSIFQDAVSALTNLGYKPPEANQIIAKIQEKKSGNTLEEIIKIALANK